MEPLLFGIQSDVVLEVLGTIVLLSLIIERFLAVIFEWRILAEKLDGKGLKEPIAFIASFIVVKFYSFDALAILFSHESQSLIGYFITAGVIAGGSKGSIKLFRDYLGWKSSARQEIENKKKSVSGD